MAQCLTLVVNLQKVVRMLSYRRKLFVVFCFLSMSGCVTIPKESVYLSEELSNMIRSAQASHLRLVNEYVTERRSQMDTFMVEKWIPEFMDNMVKNSTVLEDLKNADTPAKKGQVMLNFADAAEKEIYKRRAALVEAWNEIDRTLKGAVNAHYEDMLVVNRSLTAHLRAAAEVTATRDELLKQLNVKPQEFLPLDEINTALGKFIKYVGKVEDIQKSVEQIRAVIGGRE